MWFECFEIKYFVWRYNDKIVSGRVSGSRKNEMVQLLVNNNLFKPSINFSDIESMIASFDGSPFQM